MEHFSSDVLVIGSGAAGLRAAIEARNKGLKVLVISKGLPGMATSTILSGGAFAGARKGGDPEEHLKRTLQAGRGINQRDLLDALVKEAPSRLQEIVNWGMHSVSLEGYLYAKGRPPVWGEEILRCLIAQSRKVGAELMGGVVVHRVLMREGSASALGYSSVRGNWIAFSARALVLATGGAGALYLRHDNPQGMVGDGYALSLEAGAILQDMEFVQFYPLGLAEPSLPPLLIPPRLADKGRLLIAHEENILSKYGIKERPAAERARDRLSLALFQEIYRQGKEVWLDLTTLGEDQWCSDPLSASTRETIGERCEAKYRPLRIAPLAHHVMGGVKIDPQGATSVPGLFAAGEVTGGLHGANRMGGNALTETLVFGARAGASAACWAQARQVAEPKDLLADLKKCQPVSKENGADVKAKKLKAELRKLLWKDGGIFREVQGLTRAISRVEKIMEKTHLLFYSEDPRSVKQAVEIRHGARAALLILRAALRREESRGAHYRHDFSEQNDDHWMGHLQVRLSSKGEELWTYEPIGHSQSSE